MSSTSAITVTIPVYNGERYLAETIESLLAQTFRDFQVIFVDDCSSDGSHFLIRRTTERDSRLLLLKTPKNHGSASKVLNFALPYVAGDYFAYSSQDDHYSTDWLSEMYRTARESGAKATLPDMVFYHAGAVGELEGIRGAGGVGGAEHFGARGRDPFPRLEGARLRTVEDRARPRDAILLSTGQSS